MMASFNGHVNVARSLIAAHADIHSLNKVFCILVSSLPLFLLLPTSSMPLSSMSLSLSISLNMSLYITIYLYFII